MIKQQNTSREPSASPSATSGGTQLQLALTNLLLSPSLVAEAPGSPHLPLAKLERPDLS